MTTKKAAPVTTPPSGGWGVLRRWIWPLVLISIIIIVVAVVSYVGKLQKEHRLLEQARQARYAAFGIDVPVNYSIHGIDVSSYEALIDWQSVKEMKVQNIQVNFVFVKATEGLNDMDKQFRRNWAAAKKDSITRGAYHFFLATKSGRIQAKNFIAAVRLEKGDLPPVVDIEELYGVQPDSMRARVTEFLQAMEAYYKVKPVIYTFAEFYEAFLGKEFDQYPLWVAHYYEKDKPRIKRNWIFWQHNDKGRINGITTDVDFDVFKGDSAAFKKVLIP